MKETRDARPRRTAALRDGSGAFIVFKSGLYTRVNSRYGFEIGFYFHKLNSSSINTFSSQCTRWHRRMRIVFTAQRWRWNWFRTRINTILLPGLSIDVFVTGNNYAAHRDKMATLVSCHKNVWPRLRSEIRMAVADVWDYCRRRPAKCALLRSVWKKKLL